MSGPPEIWIDERVVRTMATGPDPNESPQGVKMIRYLNHDRVAELLVQAAGGGEFFIQISTHNRRPDQILGLTNFGRIFTYSFEAETWTSEIGIPDFGVPAGS